MIRHYKTPYYMQRLFPSCIWKKESQKSIYLTFDDGPDEYATPWVLDLLKNSASKATFFCLGKHLHKNQHLLGKIISEGHLIGNHTFDHLNGWNTGNHDYLENIQKCDKALEAHGVVNAFYRPPYGRIKRSQLKLLDNKKIIMWSHMAYDFDSNADMKRAFAILSQAPAGSIITFHDNQKAFKNLMLVLPDLIASFKERGLRMETLEND